MIIKYGFSTILFFGFLFSELFGEKFIIKLSVTENKGSGDNILNLKAYIIQNKLPINPNGSYDIISNEPDINNYFILQPRSGQLKQRNNIDRETLCKIADTCQKIILISINGQVLEVVIDIEDENDNVPVFFMRHKTLSIQENSDIGFELSLPTAEDSDSEKNSISRYFIKDSQSRNVRNFNQFQTSKYFIIVEKVMNRIKIPYLKSIKEIDREEVDRFELILVAEDSGKQQGSCTITVNVIDVNDNSPQWPSLNIYKKVRECDRQGPLVELQAFDKDDANTPNGQIKYKISDNSPRIDVINRLFYIAGSSLFLSSQGLQLTDVKGQITFFITAVDGGRRENDTTVIIEIDDCNDHAPSISITKSTVSIKENDNSMIILTTVTVKDEDKGINSEFSCDLNDTLYFSLIREHNFVQQNGGLFIIFNIQKLDDTSFDREKTSFYSVLIRCVDQGRPSLTGEKLFSVTILDENDNIPKFPSHEMKFSITENNFVGASIGYVNAYDPDSNENGRVTYQILNNEENYYFTITSFGKIESKLKFNREVKDSYSLVILAKDNGEPSLNDTCTVIINILDENDCIPVFKQQYFYQITESNSLTTIHAILGKIVAEDGDLGENGTVHYKIRPRVNSRPNDHGLSLLKINIDGTLNIYGVVDREKISSIQADVVAYDNGRPQQTAVTTVIVDILDLNDNRPRFKHPLGTINSINITNDTPIGKVLANVEAEDPDKGENGTIVYSIVSHSKSEQNLPFQLQQDGRLILVQSLKERESILKLPDRLIIRASDSGNPPKTVVLTIHIKYVTNILAQRNHLWIGGTNKKQDDKTRINSGNGDNYRESDGTDNMTMLYVLAGVLFIVFIIVLLVLVYTYFSGRFTRARHSDLTREKDLNNYCNDGTGNNYESELISPNATSCQETFAKISLSSITNPTTDKNNYTHLMRMNEAKYTPIHPNSNYIQSLCNDGSMPVQPSILQVNPDNRNYELCMQNRAESCEKPTMQTPGNKWNSIENITLSNIGKKSTSKSHDNSFFYNAHSYAAYINQFGIEEKDLNTTADESFPLNKTKIKQQTLPSQHKKTSKDDQQMFTYQSVLASNPPKPQTKKCYVSSSFV